MPFKFLTYLQPTHYFRLFKKDNHSVFPKVEELPESFLNHLSKDDSYRSPLAKDYDLSWQAIQKGYIGEADTYINFKKSTLSDESPLSVKTSIKLGCLIKENMVYLLVIKILMKQQKYSLVC